MTTSVEDPGYQPEQWPAVMTGMGASLWQATRRVLPSVALYRHEYLALTPAVFKDRYGITDRVYYVLRDYLGLPLKQQRPPKIAAAPVLLEATPMELTDAEIDRIADRVAARLVTLLKLAPIGIDRNGGEA